MKVLDQTGLQKLTINIKKALNTLTTLTNSKISEIKTINGKDIKGSGNLTLADIGVDGNVCIIVNILPPMDHAVENKLYLVPIAGSGSTKYNEYIYDSTNTQYIKLGEWHPGFTIDNTLSTTSENPIQTKVVTEALNNKVNTSDVVQQTGDSTTSIMSQKAVTDALAEGGTYHDINDDIVAIEGYRFVNYGTQAATNNWITEPIPVIAGHKLHIVCNGDYGTAYPAIFLQSDKTTGAGYVKTSQNGYIFKNNNTEIVTVPDDAAFIRLSNYMPYFTIIDLSSEDIISKVVELQYKVIPSPIQAGQFGVNSDSRWGHTPKIPMLKGEKFIIKITNNEVKGNKDFIVFNHEGEIQRKYNGLGVPENFTAPFDGYFVVGACAGNTGKQVAIEIKKFGAESGGSKKYIPRTIHTCGHSFWVRNGGTYNQYGLTKTVRGFQTIFKEQFSFKGFIDLKYDGNSLGAQSDSDTSSIALKLSSWSGSTGDIYTLDTITNDFKRNISLGTKDDFDNNTGATTYYGALRIFADKVEELSDANTVIVIVSNATHRNQAGYTSTSKNTKGVGLVDYSRALETIAEIKGWHFVDVFAYGGITDENLSEYTVDGLHPNNLGYEQAAKPWIAQLDIIYNQLLG